MPRTYSWIQEVEVEPVSQHLFDPDRRREHQGGGGVVLRQENGVHLQGQGEEGRIALSLHLGQGHQTSR